MEQCWAVSALRWAGRAGKGQIPPCISSWTVPAVTVQGLSNKGSITFCDTDNQAGDRDKPEESWDMGFPHGWDELDGADTIWGLEGPEKSKEGRRFRVQWKISTEFQKHLAAGWEIGGTQVTLKWEGALGKVIPRVGFGAEFHGWPWLGIEPSSVLFLWHLCCLSLFKSCTYRTAISTLLSQAKTEAQMN